MMETVWHGGMKDTYLCVRDLSQQSLSEARPMHAGTSRVPLSVIDVLPFDRDRAMTMGELLARTGASYAAVKRGLYAIRKAGLLGSEIHQVRRGTQGREPRLYWRRAV